jgi:hypothetical protein
MSDQPNNESRWWKLVPNTCLLDFQREAVLFDGQHTWPIS